MNKYLRLWKRNFFLELQSDMIYKVNFFINIVSLMLTDVIAPLVTFIIYETTAGIPGWTLQEFILFQGAFILTFGMMRFVYLALPFMVIEAIRDGSFDKYLVKPFNPLLQLTLSSWTIDGIAPIITGTLLIVWSSLSVSITLGGVLLFVLMILIGNVFLYSFLVIVSAVAFLVVRSYALFDVFWKLNDFGRYPLTIYAGALKFSLVYLLPVGVVAFYPSQALMGLLRWDQIPLIVLPVAVFFILALLLWNKAMKNYSSAGG